MSYQNRIFSSLFPHLSPRPTITDGSEPNDASWMGNWSGGGEQVDIDTYTPATDDTTNDQRQLIDQSVVRPPMVAPDAGVAFPSTMQAPQPVSANGKPVEFTEAFALPFPEPKSNYESAQNALAMGRNNFEHPVNKDHGVKGALKDILVNLQRTGQFIRPGMSLGESLAVAGAGIAGGLLDRTQNERQDAARIMPGLEKDVQVAGQAETRQNQWNNWDADNRRQEAKNAAEYELKTKTLDWKKEDRDRYYELEGVKQSARERKDTKTFEQAEKKQQELERHNKATETLGEKRIESNEKIAGLSQEAQTKRTQLAIEARRLLNEYNQAQQNGRAEQARQLKARMAAIKMEADALMPGIREAAKNPQLP